MTIAMNSDESTALNNQVAKLLPKCAHSDTAAFADVYNLTSSRLFAVIVRTLGMNAAAEQALQDTYVKVWLQSDEYRADLREPMAWLTDIARTHVSQVLHEQRTQIDSRVTLPATKLNYTELAKVQFLDKSDQVQMLEARLSRLDDQPRDCILRAYAEGSSLAELGELHDAPAGTVHSWIQRGLLSLKEGVHEFS